MRVLIIDDTEYADKYRHWFADANVELSVNEECADPQLIIIDPGIHTTCDALNSLTDGNLNVIVATDRGDILHCRSHGDVGAITKPFAFEELSELASIFFGAPADGMGSCH